MTDFHWHSLICVTILASIHLFSVFANFKIYIWRTRFLSMAGGVAVSYVFVELMLLLGISGKNASRGGKKATKALDEKYLNLPYSG